MEKEKRIAEAEQKMQSLIDKHSAKREELEKETFEKYGHCLDGVTSSKQLLFELCENLDALKVEYADVIEYVKIKLK